MSYYYYSSVGGINKRGRSSCSSSSMPEIQHLRSSSKKKPRVDHHDYRKKMSSLSSSSCRGKEINISRAASEVLLGKKKREDVAGFSADPISKAAARVETLKKRFGRIIVKAEEFQVVVRRRRSDYYNQKQLVVDSVEMQRKKNLILKKKLKEAEVVAEIESKMELQRKREAAKKALEELEKNIVKVDDNETTMKDFAVILGYPRNCALCLCNEIGWYGAPVLMVHSKKIKKIDNSTS